MNTVDFNKPAKGIYKTNKAKDFHSAEHLLCLVISELMEAVEADREGRTFNDMGCTSDFEHFYRDESKLGFKEAFELNIKDTVSDKLANAVMRILDTAGVLGLQLKEIDKDNNFDYYATKDDFIKHSFTENVFHIIDRYFRSSEIISNRMSRMIFHINILCEVMDIDLLRHVDLKLRYNSLSPHKHSKWY